MGSDDLHHKRKQRSIESLKRQQGNRAQHEVVLIVCEGRKTEPYYFRGLCDELQLHPANIHIFNSPYGNDPISLVKYAQEMLEQQQDWNHYTCYFKMRFQVSRINDQIF